MMSSGDHLPSGTYVIQAQDHNIMIADPDTSDSPVKTASGSEKDQTYKWFVTYYKNDKNYTIRAGDKKLYAVTDSNNDTVNMATTSQRFNISRFDISHHTVYEIETMGGDQAFQYEGNDKQVLTVNPNGAARIYWKFQECSPYTISSETSAYFESNPEGKLLCRFGLSNHFTWDELWECIDNLNANAQGAAFYKLFLLGRHGHNEHDIKAELGDDYDGFDPGLTQRGCVQAGHIRDVWDSVRCEHPGIGLPQLSLCSPMRRALATNTIAFSKELSAKKVSTPKMTTLVVENCRERMYKDDSENRHTKNWISNMFYNFQIEHGFTDQDELWDPKHEESLSSFRARVRKFLDRVFSPENASVKFVFITAHHEWSAMFMEVAGQQEAIKSFM